MSLPTCSVIVDLSDPNGRPLVGAVVSARLSGVDLYQGMVVPTLVEVKTDTAGRCLLALWPNALGAKDSSYQLRIRHPQARSRVIPDIRVPAVAAVTLQQLLGLPDSTPLQVWDDGATWNDSGNWTD